MDQTTLAVEPPPKAAAAKYVTGTLVVFVASAATLVLEITAMRLVAPYIGVTLQTSSAVIGTALTAMAVGAWAGGRLADRIDSRHLPGPLLLVGGVLTLMTAPLVRLVGERLVGGPAVPVVLAMALLAVFPPSAVLSAVTPVVIKIQLADLGRTGSVVGRLSATATLGGITATFLTGFVLIAHFRTSAVLFGTGALLALAGAGLLWRRPFRIPLAASLASLLTVAWIFVVAPSPCQSETDYHCLRIVETPKGSSGRLLWLDTGAHSYVDLADPRALKFEYARAMVTVADTVIESPAPVQGLYLGGGGFTLPRYQAATRPGSSATVLEIDRKVVDTSLHELGAMAIPRLSIKVGDARTALAREPANRYDLVIGDAFGTLAVPWHLTTREVATDIRRTLRPGGIYLVNVIDYMPDAFARAELATLRTVFPHVAMAAPAPVMRGSGGGNHVLIASAEPIPVPEIAERLRVTTPEWRVIDEGTTARFAARSRPLSDEFAPVDQLLSTRPAR